MAEFPIYEFPTYEEMGKMVAEEALDRYVYNGKTLREWVDTLSSLENQNKCEDAISRQAVLDVTKRELFMGDAISEIEDLPPVTPKQRWIPVSERMPEDGKKVLVTVNFFDDGAKVRISENDKYGFLCGNVSAWMPLPEPYEPQESED